MKPDPVLVTGAGGFVGGHLIDALSARNYRIFCHSKKDGDLSRCTLEYPDVRHVFHLAAKSFVPDSWKDPRSFYEVNVLATANVLELCRKSGASLTYLSSYVYGLPQRIPIPEDHPLQAFNPYGHSKILAEDICRFYSSQFGVRVSIIRPFNVYGPRQDQRFLIPTLLQQALAPGRTFIEVADDRPRRDFLYISDLVRLIIATAEQGAVGVYNAGSGASIGIGEIVDVLNRLAPSPKKLISRGESRTQDVMDLAADISKAARELQWTPTIDIASGLRLMVEAS